MTTVATFAELLARAQNFAARELLALQTIDIENGPISETFAKMHRERCDRFRAAITSAHGLIKTGHAQEAFRHLSEVVGS